jgi:tetratricopeptide (TPR) repeat protein
MSRGWSQEELVEHFEAEARRLGLVLSLSVRQVRRWETDQPPWPHPPHRKVLEHLFKAQIEALGFRRPVKSPAWPTASAEPPTLEPITSVLEEEDAVLRRAFLRTGVGVLAANRVAVALLAPADPHSRAPVTAAMMRRDVARAKTAFQACRYDELDQMLPQMLARAVVAADGAATDDAKLEARTVQTDLLHVATSLLLKQGRVDLALVAADRATQAASASHDTVAQLAAARIVTHAAFAAGHGAIADELVTRNADRFASSIDGHSPQLTSVYGALLLRGSVASAKQGDRRRAAELLREAEQLATTLEPHANHAWTSFNSNNVLVHRVATAVELGDAGEAIDRARGVDIGAIPVVERRAALWVDLARAFGQWQKGDEAVRALLAAERIAPEEVRGRRAVQLLVDQLRRQHRGLSSEALTGLASRVGGPA